MTRLDPNERMPRSGAFFYHPISVLFDSSGWRIVGGVLVDVAESCSVYLLSCDKCFHPIVLHGAHGHEPARVECKTALTRESRY